MRPILKDWHMGVSVKYDLELDDPYKAPEQLSKKISGQVYGHPDYPNGKRIRTSDIKKVEGNIITTKSGHEYELGKANTDYMEWCEREGYHVPTKQEPIKEIL